MGITRGQAFPSNYFSKEDCQTPIIGTIESVELADIQGDNGAERKPIMHFREEHMKPMIINNTNFTTCEVAFGFNTDSWIGKQVEIYFDPTVMFGKERKGGVRLRIQTSKAANKPSVPVWSLDEAVAEAAKVGISREQILASFKSMGFKGWNMNTCPPVVKAMIDAKRDDGHSFEDAAAPLNVEDIPF